MIPHRYVLITVILFILSGCTAFNPMVVQYENNFSHFEASPEELVKSTSIKMNFHQSYDDVWESAIYILAQQSVIIDSSRESGIITYMNIDGIHFGDVFPEDSIYYWEFPYTALFERGDNEVNVFIYPMRNLYDEKDRKKNWWKVIDAGFSQQGEEFLDRLSTQLTAGERWQWLRQLGSAEARKNISAEVEQWSTGEMEEWRGFKLRM